MRYGYDRIGGLVWMGLGVVFFLGGARMGLGTLQRPGTGFLPLVMGGLLTILGLSLTLRPVKGEEAKVSLKEFGGKGVYTLIVLFLYPLFLQFLGFILATILLFFFLFKILEPQKWLTPIFVSLVTALFSYYLFVVVLRIMFPVWIFG